MGLGDLPMCHKSEKLSSATPGPFHFSSLIGWGKEIGPCDVNKENESLPKVKPAVQQPGVLVK